MKRLKRNLETEKSNREKEQKRSRELEETVSKLEKEKDEMENMLLVKQQNIDDLQKQVCKLTEELDLLKYNRTFEVQLLPAHCGALISSAMEDLITQITSQSPDNEFEVHRCSSAVDIQPDIPLLVLFFGTNVAQSIRHALKTLPTVEKAAAVVVHLKAEHALPAQTTDRLISVKDFEPLGAVFDIGFLPDKGIYKCEMNDTNLVNIANYVRVNGQMRRGRTDIKPDNG